MTTIGLLRKSQIDICVYTNTHYLICYVHTHVHIWIILLHHTHDTLDLSDISEFEDLMTTSSDDDIPGLDDEIWLAHEDLWTMVNSILDHLSCQYFLTSY